MTIHYLARVAGGANCREPTTMKKAPCMYPESICVCVDVFFFRYRFPARWVRPERLGPTTMTKNGRRGLQGTTQPATARQSDGRLPQTMRPSRRARMQMNEWSKPSFVAPVFAHW